jgi:uncharacterized protein
MSENVVTVAAQANPTAVGLVAFGMTTILLNLIHVGVLPPGGEAVVIPLGLAFGGLTQIFAGVFEFSLGHTFGVTSFLGYGAFWWWYALLQLFAGNHLIDISAAGATVGVALLLWGLFTLYMWISTFRHPRVIFLVFLTLWMSLGLLGLGAIEHSPSLTHAGGWLGVISGCLALYGSFGIVTNDTFGRAIVPLGATPLLPWAPLTSPQQAARSGLR